MDSFESILTYPTERDDWVRTVLIGGVLVFLGVFLIPLIMVYGYALRVIRGSLAGETEPPVFEEWGDMLVEGIQGWIVGLIYMLIPLVVAAITVGGAMMALVTGGSPGAAAGGLAFGFVLSGVLSLVFGYVAVAAIVNFARKQEFGAAFDFGTLRRVLVHRDYAVAWLVSAVILAVVGLVGSIPVIGWLIVPFASFYALVVAGNLWADGFSAALSPDDAASDVTEEPAV
jgi:hypothetical protein